MVTRWSHAHGELYLRRKRDDGVVADVEELTVVWWLKGIGQRCSVEAVWLTAAMGSRYRNFSSFAGSMAGSSVGFEVRQRRPHLLVR